MTDSTPLSRVRTPVHAETKRAEFTHRVDAWLKIEGVQEIKGFCAHDVVALWDANGHNFLDIIGYHNESELQIVVDLINRCLPIMYACQDVIEQEAVEGGSAYKHGLLVRQLIEAVIGEPELGEDDDEEGYTLGEVRFDL